MKTILAALCLIVLACPALADRLSGVVVGVHDGDTITVLTAEHQTLKIRLAQIDAPELGQPYGQKAKQALSALVFRKAVDLEAEATDRYGRTVATVKINGHDINSELVATGAAWAYPDYVRDPLLLDLQAEAIEQRRGLWALQNDQIEAPWDWRRERRQRRQPH